MSIRHGVTGIDVWSILYVRSNNGKVGRQEAMQKTAWEGSENSEEGIEEGKEEPFITVREAAAIIGITSRAVRQRIEDGRLCATMTEGRYYLTRDAVQPDTNAAETGFLPRKKSGRKPVSSFRPTPVPSFPSNVIRTHDGKHGDHRTER